MGEGKPSHTEAKSTSSNNQVCAALLGEVLDPEIVFEVEEDGTFFYSEALWRCLTVSWMGL
jgi:hypothetical protein